MGDSRLGAGVGGRGDLEGAEEPAGVVFAAGGGESETWNERATVASGRARNLPAFFGSALLESIARLEGMHDSHSLRRKAFRRYLIGSPGC